MSKRQICPWTQLAPPALIDEAEEVGLKRKKISARKRAEYEAYNVIGFGGGGGAVEYSAMMTDHFTPGMSAVTLSYLHPAALKMVLWMQSKRK